GVLRQAEAQSVSGSSSGPRCCRLRGLPGWGGELFVFGCAGACVGVQEHVLAGGGAARTRRIAGHDGSGRPHPSSRWRSRGGGGGRWRRDESLRAIAAPCVAVGPSGVAIRTRLKHLSAEDEEVLRLVGAHLGSLAARDLKRRCADGLEHSAERWAGRK